MPMNMVIITWPEDAQTIYYQKNLAFCFQLCTVAPFVGFLPLVFLYLGFLPLQHNLIWLILCVLLCLFVCKSYISADI